MAFIGVEIFSYTALISWITWLALSAGYDHTGSGTRWIYFAFAGVIVPLAIAVIFSRIAAIIDIMTQ